MPQAQACTCGVPRFVPGGYSTNSGVSRLYKPLGLSLPNPYLDAGDPNTIGMVSLNRITASALTSLEDVGIAAGAVNVWMWSHHYVTDISHIAIAMFGSISGITPTMCVITPIRKPVKKTRNISGVNADAFQIHAAYSVVFVFVLCDSYRCNSLPHFMHVF